MKNFIFSNCYRIDGYTGNAVEASINRNESITFNDAYRDNLTSGGEAEFNAAKNFEKLQKAVLHGARNEFVSFQMALQDVTVPFEEIDLTFTTLKSPEGSICECNFKPYFEWFHNLKGMLIPDLLLPWDDKRNSYDVTKLAKDHYKATYTAFWIDLFIPADAIPGFYTATLDVKAGSITASFPIEVTVYNPILCNEALIQADMNNYADTVSRNFPTLMANDKRFEDGSFFKAERNFFRISHENRCFFHHLPYSHSSKNWLTFAPKLEGEGKNIRVSDWTLFDEHYESYLNGEEFKDSERGPIPLPYCYLPFCFDWPSSYEKWGTKGFKTENRRIMLDFIEHFEEKGWKNTVFEIFLNHKKRYRFFPYDGDETRFKHDEEVIEIYDDIFNDIIKETDVKILIRTDSSWSFGEQYATKYSKMIQMWTVGNGCLQFWPEAYEYMKKQGTILWTYTGLPSLESDMTGIYKYPLQCLQNEWTGFLYWNSSGIGSDFLNCPQGNGSETLYYPAHPFNDELGVLPSIRLKYQRDCMQQVDLIKMYEGTWTFHKMREKINTILNIAKSDWYAELPEALQCPPHQWTNEGIGGADFHDVFRNVTPEIHNTISEEILEMAHEFVGGISIWR